MKISKLGERETSMLLMRFDGKLDYYNEIPSRFQIISRRIVLNINTESSYR